jgi:hypothetical protein
MRKVGIVAALILMFFAFCSFFQSAKALGNVKILSHSSFYDSLNTLWVVGEVENTGDMATQFTKVTATFYNSSNQVVAVETGYTEIDVLLPGRKSPFDIMLSESDGSLKVYNYSLTVSWDNYAAGKPLALQILSNSSRIDELGYMHVLGEIKNTGSLTARFTKAIATFYDANGTVVGEASSYTEPSDINSKPNSSIRHRTHLHTASHESRQLHPNSRINGIRANTRIQPNHNIANNTARFNINSNLKPQLNNNPIPNST